MYMWLLPLYWLQDLFYITTCVDVKWLVCTFEHYLLVQVNTVTAEYPATLYHYCFRWSVFFKERSITQ